MKPNPTQWKLILVALGRVRDGMPQPEVVDDLAASIEQDLGAEAGRLYEMARGAPMSGRTQLIASLVDGNLLTPREPVTHRHVLLAMEAAARAEATEAWLHGQVDEPDTVYGHEVYNAMHQAYRNGPRFAWLFDPDDGRWAAVLAEFTARTGIPSAWTRWTYDDQWIIDEVHSRQTQTQGTPRDPHAVEKSSTRWMVEVIDPVAKPTGVLGRYEPNSVFTTVYVEVSREGSGVELVITMDGAELDSATDVYTYLSEDLEYWDLPPANPDEDPEP